MTESTSCPPPPESAHEDIRKAYELLAEFNPVHGPENPPVNPHIHPKGNWQFEIMLTHKSCIEISNCHSINYSAPEHYEWDVEYETWGDGERHWDQIGRFYTPEEMAAAVKEWMTRYKAENPN